MVKSGKILISIIKKKIHNLLNLLKINKWAVQLQNLVQNRTNTLFMDTAWYLCGISILLNFNDFLFLCLF